MYFETTYNISNKVHPSDEGCHTSEVDPQSSMISGSFLFSKDHIAELTVTADSNIVVSRIIEIKISNQHSFDSGEVVVVAGETIFQHMTPN